MRGSSIIVSIVRPWHLWFLDGKGFMKANIMTTLDAIRFVMDCPMPDVCTVSDGIVSVSRLVAWSFIVAQHTFSVVVSVIHA